MRTDIFDRVVLMAPCAVLSRCLRQVYDAAGVIGVTRHAGKVVVEADDRLARDHSRRGVADLGRRVRIGRHLSMTIHASDARGWHAAPWLMAGGAVRSKFLVSLDQLARGIAAMKCECRGGNQQHRASE